MPQIEFVLLELFDYRAKSGVCGEVWGFACRANILHRLPSVSISSTDLSAKAQNQKPSAYILRFHASWTPSCY